MIALAVKIRGMILCLLSIVILNLVAMVAMVSMASIALAQVDSTHSGINFDSPQQYALYQKVINELRCLVCQNQTLADSNADLAKDLRRKSYEMVKQNKGYADIIQYMLVRYGDFVLYRPRITPATWLLWFSPFVFLITILGFVLIKIRKPTHAKFSKQEMARAQSIINNKFSS